MNSYLMSRIFCQNRGFITGMERIHPGDNKVKKNNTSLQAWNQVCVISGNLCAWYFFNLDLQKLSFLKKQARMHLFGTDITFFLTKLNSGDRRSGKCTWVYIPVRAITKKALLIYCCKKHVYQGSAAYVFEG